jgi:diacylglycerol kinase (ATP)
MARYLIIANPVSGAQAAPQAAAEVLARLKSAGQEAELQLTQKRGHARELAAAAVQGGLDVVVACGGDGTLQEIATALEETPVAMGVLPRGRCNDFARAIPLPRRGTAADLATILLARKQRRVDLGAVGTQRFLSIATLGFDSEVSRFVETRRLPLKGTAAYLYGVVHMLVSYRFPRVRLSGDFGVREGRILLVATGNTDSYGGALRVCPGAKLDDGQFQVCFARAVSRPTVLFSLLPRLLKGTHIHHPAVEMLTTRRLEISTPDGPQWICADGETLCQTPCTFTIRPGTLRLIVP